MKRLFAIIAALLFVLNLFPQSPLRISYQAVVRNANGKLVQSSSVGVRISILQGSASGAVVYSETHNVTSNVNGLISLEIGGGNTMGNFADINWANGPYFLKTETDPAGGTNYNIAGVSQLLSVPYALYSEKAGNGFSGDYNDLINKPVTDGSETKVQGGKNISVTGTGTAVDPYKVQAPNCGGSEKITITSSQTWNVPPAVSKIKVELWGAAGGGGGAGAYSYSYNLVAGGNGGSGGFAQKMIDVTENEQFNVIIGEGGAAGSNATYNHPNWLGDTDGDHGGDSWFGTLVKAAGGTGGKRGSYAYYTIHGSPGTSNIGTVTGYSEDRVYNILNVFQGLERTYISDRYFTSRPGKGGNLSPYSEHVIPTSGEGGCAIITLFE